MKVKNQNNANIKFRFFTSDFWSSFAKNNWEKEEFVLNDGSVAPPLSEEQLFKVIVSMVETGIAEFERSGESDEAVRLYIGDSTQELRKGFYHLYPRIEDRTFLGYGQRVESLLHGQEFSFVVDEIDLSPELKEWSYDFLKGMYRPLKTVSYGHFWSIFFGNYSTTVYGVHHHATDSEAESAFYFPIIGNKQMRTWRPSYIAKNPELADAREYSQHEKSSTLLEADSGGMMYWPSDRWHIGSSTGGDVSIVLAVKAFSNGIDTLGMMLFEEGLFNSYIRPGIFGYAAKSVAYFGCQIYAWRLAYSKRTKDRQIRAFPFDPDDLTGSAASIPDEVKKIVKPFRFLFGQNLEKVMSIFWLTHLTTFGMKTSPPKASRVSIDRMRNFKLQRCSGAILLWRQVDLETVIVVSGFSNQEVPLWFLPVVESLAEKNVGKQVRFVDLVGQGAEGETYDFEHVLAEFVNFLLEADIYTVA